MSLAWAGRDQQTTEKRPVVDEYYGIKVTDDYRWLENWDDPAVQTWSNGQNASARSLLDALPSRDAIRQRVTALHASQTEYRALISRAGRYFALKREASRQQPFLVTMAGIDDLASERTVVDPGSVDSEGGTAIDWYVPSPDGALVAVSMSKGGSERGDVHIFETASGQPAGDVIPRVYGGTAGGSVSWAADSRGFYYTRYPRPGERPAEDLDFYTQVYFHALGTPESTDRYEIGKDFPRIAEINLRTSPDGRFVLANVANGDGGEFAQFLRAPSGRWTQLTTFADKVAFGTFGEDATLYLLSRSDAPRGKILRLPLRADFAPRLADAAVLVPESADGVIDYNFGNPDTLVVGTSRLFVVELIGGPHRISTYTLAGKPAGTIPLPRVAAVAELVPTASGGVLYNASTFIAPPAWYEQTTGSGDRSQPRRVLASSATEEWPGVEVIRETAQSRDGTPVPLNIIRRKGVRLNGDNPTLLIGYGGYGISLSPYFLGANRIWLEHGGVLVIANLRGGGEFGEKWHLAGSLTKKQRVFDDFLAAAQHLIKTRYTSPARLAIEGGSNGGLLMGAVLTQKPELFKAVVSHVGIYDMLRVELSPNGAFNVPEFGSVKNADQFHAMHAYSPYHHVKDGTKYPATLFLTGANDPRVDPMHSRKMTARLQAATSSGQPVLLRTSASSGHGMGTALSEQIEQEVDVFTFLFAQLGVTVAATP